MSTPFQNRLVGTIIVAAAAIIFLPDILDGEKQSHQADFEGIPKAPKFESTQEVKSFPTEKLAQLPKEGLSDELALDEGKNEAAEPSVAASNNTDRVKVAALLKKDGFNDGASANGQKSKVTTSDKKVLPEKSVAGEAWVIQLGSFRHKKNVEDLVTKLKKNGYTAFTRPIKTKNGTLTKVFVGPELTKTAMEKKLPKLKELTKVQGKVARFYPTK